MVENKVLYGLDKIHYAKKGGVVKPLKNAKSIEVVLSQNYTYGKIGGSNAIRFNSPIEGKGTLNILGLTLEEKSDLLGYEYINGEMIVGQNPNPPHVALLFARKLKNGAELYTVLYNCIFENTNISSNTYEGECGHETLTLKFDVLVDLEIKVTGITLDTKTANQDKVNNFFKFIQLPDEGM